MDNRKFAAGVYHSRAWAECRKAYVKSVGGLCEDCMARGIVTPGVDVHHIIPLTPGNVGDPNVTLNWNNLRLLCEECHAARHRGGGGRRWSVDADGRVTAREAPRKR